MIHLFILSVIVISFIFLFQRISKFKRQCFMQIHSTSTKNWSLIKLELLKYPTPPLNYNESSLSTKEGLKMWCVGQTGAQGNIVSMAKRIEEYILGPGETQTEKQKAFYDEKEGECNSTIKNDIVPLIWLIEKTRKVEGGCTMNHLIKEICQNFTGLDGIELIKK